ncbi:MAG: glycosyltransferase family 4 protein, partial [Chloroflexota bacterium]|nr:glycosyltransferase family 4 protein [Chloroflexota bacterium]
MKLCLVSPYEPRFVGLGNYVKALLPSLLGFGGVDRLVVLSDTDAAATRAFGGRLELQPAWDPESPLALSQIVRALQREQPDVAWFNTGLICGRNPLANMARLYVPVLARRRGIHSVVTLHHMMEAEPLNLLGVRHSPIHRAAGHLATRWQFKADRVCLTLRRYVALAEQTYKAKNAVHIPHHTFGLPPATTRTGTARRLLFFGVMAPYKGIDVLLDAFSRARKVLPALELRLAGARHPRFDGQVVDRSPLPGVCWLGAVPERRVDQLMRWADVVVVPSLASTGSSSVIHRAAAHGKTIVASAIPDFMALAQDEHIAMELVEPGNPGILS